MERAHDLIHRKDEVLLSARFVPGYRIAINMTAGGVRLPWRRCLVIDAVSTALWQVVLGRNGLAAGSLFHDRPLLGIVVGVALGLGLGWIISASARLARGAGQRARGRRRVRRGRPLT